MVQPRQLLVEIPARCSLCFHCLLIILLTSLFHLTVRRMNSVDSVACHGN